MPKLDDLRPLLKGSIAVKFKPSINSIFLEIPGIDHPGFDAINTIFKNVSENHPLSISVSFTGEKWIDLKILSGRESFEINKLAPHYNFKRKLLDHSPATIELVLYDYGHLGFFIGTKFKLEIT
jgi:hypothetical protein